MKWIVACLPVAALWGASAVAGETSRLTGREIEALFSGAAMSGDFPDTSERWSERTTRSGRVLNLLDGGKHIGTWFVAGQSICYVYYGHPPLKPCYRIARASNGDILFYETPGETLAARATSVKPSRR